MEVKNILLGVFGTLIVLLGGYLIYDKSIKPDETIIEQQEKNENSNIEEKNETSISNNTSLNLTELPKNYDDSYGSIKRINYESNYATLSADGMVTVCNSNGCEELKNVKNAVDIVEFYSTKDDTYKIYILDLNGNIFKYTNGDSSYNANKFDEYKNIKRIFTYNYGPVENAGMNETLYAITDDNDYIVIETSAF